MLKKFFLFVIGTAPFNPSHAQSFMHGIGLNVVTQSSPIIAAQKTELSVIYSPRFNFTITPNSTISAGMPISVAFTGFYSDSVKNNSTLRWMLDLPFMLDFNYGAGSSKKNPRKFGFFAGGRIGYHTNLFSS